MLKKSAIVLSSFSSLQSLYTPPPILTASPCLTTSNAAKRKSPILSQHQQCRAYAMIAGGHSKHEHENLPWPEVTTANAIPTPYQIFNQRKGSPYSKHRFFELVKLYHPDRHRIDGVSDGVPYSTKLERYRLIIAANEILSDPVKREAYDRYGAGWNGQPGVMEPVNASGRANYWSSYAGKGWGEGRGGPFQNATWEDWEKWYARNEKAEQSPTLFSNGTFVALIVIFAALGGIGQATRIGNVSMTFIGRRDMLHDEMSKELGRRRRESNSMGNRDERVHNFLKQRDPFGYGVMDSDQDAYRRVFTEAEICSSGDIQTRSVDIHVVVKESKP